MSDTDRFCFRRSHGETDKERAHLIKLLQESQKEYLSYVENVSEAQWNWKPGQDPWSVGETAEHILLAEGRLFSAMERAVAAPPNPDSEKSTAGKAELLERPCGWIDSGDTALWLRSSKALSSCHGIFRKFEERTGSQRNTR